MTVKYPQYLLKDGISRVSSRYFNPIWRDIDGRLDTLEQLKVSWQSAVNEVRDFGLLRIDSTLSPVLAAAQAELAAAQAASAQLQQMIEDADIQGQLDTAFAAQSAAVTADLDALETALSVAIAAVNTTLGARITAIENELETLRPLIFAGL